MIVEPRQELTSAELIRFGRDVPAQFDVRVWLNEADARLHCDAVLRVLPGRRVVVRATLDDRIVLAKLFVGRRFEADCRREERGHAALIAAGVPTPALLHRVSLRGLGAALLFEFLGGATPIEAHDLLAAMPLLAKMHDHGIVQHDPHRGNWLRTSTGIYVVDGGAVMPSRAGERNLAQLLAQFPVSDEPLFDAAWRCYVAARDMAVSDTTFIPTVRRARRWRMRAYLRKVLRDCTEFVAAQRFDRFIVCQRTAWTETLRALVDDIDASMARAELVKAGNTTTIGRLRVAGRSILIKRYNIKSFRHAASRAWRPSRALRAWQNVHRLRLLGIATFEAVALIERRWGPLRRGAYLLMREIEGCGLPRELDASQRAGLVRLLTDLARAGIVHGDMKATNFVWGQGVVHLLDLDAMHMPVARAAFRRAFARDIERCLANWPGDSLLGAQLNAIVGAT